MRENEFRAWDKNRNEMLYDGSIINIGRDYKEASVEVTSKGILYWRIRKKSTEYVTVHSENGNRDYYCNWDELDIQYPSSDLKIMQYTGLKDKNDKEIYEGDVILYSSVDFATVIFKDGAFIENRYGWNLPKQENGFMLKVVGNIYENPELIKS